MCQGTFHSFLARLPKCEHHMHLEGSLTPELLFSLAAKNNLELPRTNPIYDSVASYTAHLSKADAFEDLDSFLKLYYTGMNVLQTQQDFHDLGISYFTRAHLDNVRHVEVFFDPQAHTSRGVDYQTVLGGFKSACVEAEDRFGITTKLIMCFLRHLSAKDAIEHYQVARSDLLSGIVAGIGLDSSEKEYPPEIFQGVYALARHDNVTRTAHAGEESGPEAVTAALDVLQVQRIDHGRTIPQDSALLKRIATEQILVTLCPLSNVKLQGVQKLEDLPVRTFLDARVRFSINSDDPAYFGGFVLENCCAVQQAFGLTVNDWQWICESAIQGSWCDDRRKAVLMQELAEVVSDYYTLSS